MPDATGSALSVGVGDAAWSQGFGSDVLSCGVGDVQYQVDGYPNTTASFNTPLFPEFDDTSLHTYIQPDLFVQDSTSTSPFTLPLEHYQTPVFPATSTSSSSSVQVSPLPPPPMEYAEPRPPPPPSHRASKDDDPTVALKRQRNTAAARKYRQKRIDRIAELEEAVDQLKSERDELRIKLARQEAETAALKEMLRAKGA
ncbi:hypothetical protein NKR19_g5685 [Coniochaeta hoffmannii]|uniref:BZIP domain-containing protein n=1 Tax=Coniochaeta hoffmannii TaxID=91930 RepID=A0AA38RGS4_9PEZI|nr:hypothetical protein NKR19_g5685 [Coniochaeta hoffmannii]